MRDTRSSSRLDTRRHGWVALAIAVASGSFLVGQPASREVRLTISEGTSMAAAVSPDGTTIAIDLLGGLWTVGIDGGAARRILEDGYDARMPTWSPDGRQLAFQAYLRDTWHIWVVNRDGTGLREVTAGPFDDREPHWSPDGTRLAFSSDRSGNYDIWTVTLATGAVRRQTTNDANDSMPAWSPDGREIAFVSDRTDRGIYARAVDGTAERRLVAASATIHTPAWTRDGRTVAYVSVSGAVSRLMVGTSAVSDAGEDVFPFRPQWIGAGELLYTADGLIKRRPRAGGPARPVSFSADVAFTRPAFTPKRPVFAPEGPQPVRGLMHPVVSPDGRRVAFAALGDLWLVSASGGDAVPERLTNDPFVDMHPSWSPDGNQLAFSSDRGGQLDLWVRDLRTGRDRRVASGGQSASWSPDGTRLAYLDRASQLHVVDVASGEGRQAHERLNEPGRPSWSPDGRAVVMSALRPYSTRFREGTNQVLWVQVEPDPSPTGRGTLAPDRWFDPLPHASIGMRENLGPVWSPSGREMAAIVGGYLAVYPVLPDGTPTGAPRRVSADFASSPSWTADSRHVLYQALDRFRLVDLADGSVRDIVPRLTWTARTTTGAMTVHAGRLFDGRGESARENVDVVIDGNRITGVEPHRDDLHRGPVVDASGMTVLPGLIETHTHLSKEYGEVLGRIWLAFGITTVRNPAANPFEALEDREAIRSGRRLGPRVVATGEPIDGTRVYYPGGVALDSGAMVDAQMARAETLGFDLIKTYVRLPDLLQKRIVEAAHRLGMPVTSHEIYPAVAWGADGVEHIRGTSRRGFSPKMSETRRSYRDVIDLLAASGMTLTPTIGIQGGHQLLTLRDGSWLEDARLAKLFPASALASSRGLRAKPISAADLAGREAMVTPQERMVAELVKAGGRVIAGTDSPINPYGMSLLLELEHFVRGGVSPAQAIRTATAVAAEAMGLGADLGTIEVGKLADLLVVDGNPLTDIKDLRRMRVVVHDGVRHDMETLMAGPSRSASSGAQVGAQPPELTTLLGRPVFARADADGAIARADAALAADPRNVDLILAAARARDVALQFRAAIDVYTRGLAIAPQDVRLLRFRGHRYISTRRFDLAVRDLRAAVALAPSSFDVTYHLALAHYLRGEFDEAARVYRSCLDATSDPSPLPQGWRSCMNTRTTDNDRVAVMDWLYRSLRRAGRDADARALLSSITADMKVGENEAYYTALRFYAGQVSEEAAMAPVTKSDNRLVTVGYGVALFHLSNGDTTRACALLRRIAGEPNWNAFGVIAAEVDLAERGVCR